MSIVLTRQVQHDELLMRLSNALMPSAFQINLGATLPSNLTQLLHFFSIPDKINMQALAQRCMLRKHA